MNNSEQPELPHGERRIALISPERVSEQRAAQAIKLFGSMLWAFEETQRSRWTVAPPETADVIVVSPMVDRRRLADWKQSGKLVVVVASDVDTEIDADLSSAHVLVSPFRAAYVLSLLARLDRQLSPPSEPQISSVTADIGRAANENVSPWAFVSTLHTLQELQNTEAWLIGRDGNTALLWLKADGYCYVAEPSITHAIRRGALDLSWLNLRQGSPPPFEGPAERAGIELAWFAGYHASAELAPWLNPQQRFRLARRPDYELILPWASQLRVCDILAETASDMAELAACASVSVEEAARTVNALAACGLLAQPDTRRSRSVLPIVKALTSRLPARLRPSTDY